MNQSAEKMVGKEYPNHLDEPAKCPVPDCDYEGSLIQVHSHLHAVSEEVHEKVAERYSNAYYPPSDKIFEKNMERNYAKDFAEKVWKEIHW